MLNLLGSRLGCSLSNLDVEHLPREIPLIERRIHVETFIALQTNQLRAQHSSQYLGHLSLAHASFAFQENRLFQLHRQKDDGGQSAVADIVMGAHRLLQGFDRIKFHTYVYPLATESSCAHHPLSHGRDALDSHLIWRQGHYIRRYAL